MRKLIVLLLVSLPCFATVALDNYQTGSDNGGGGALSWTHTNHCSTNCMGYVLLSSLTNPSITLSWGGTPMTLLASHARMYGPNGPGTLYFYCIVAPPAGAATVTGTAAGWLLGASVTLSGAKQSCTADATGFTENGSYSGNLVGGVGYEYPASITPVASNAWVLAMFSGAVFNVTTATGTYRVATDMYSDFFAYDAGGTVTGTHSLSAASSTASTVSYSALLVSVAPFGAAAATYTSNPTIITVGP